MAESLARLDALAAEAQAGGADLLMLPEMFLCGYGRSAPVTELAVAPGDETEAALRTLARRRGISRLLGCAERSGSALYNSAMLVPRDGTSPACTRKMHLWGGGAGVILAISATWAGYEIVPRAIVPARAYESAVFVAFCNSVGSAHGIAYAGLSGIAGPAGDVLAQALADAEHMLFTGIDPARLAARLRPRPQHADRRVDLIPIPPAPAA